MDAALPHAPTATSPGSATQVELWNPNAAALWSIVFTPVFGAYLHALNWRALGDRDREDASMTWVFAGGALLLLILLAEVVVTSRYNTGDGAVRTIEFGFLTAWYFSSARAQVTLVKERFGGSFTRKSWRKPLLYGLAGFGIYIALMIAISAVIGLRNL